MILHTKYEGSMPCDFRQDFLCFSCKNLCKTCDPSSGPKKEWGHFWPQGHDLNKLAKSPLDDDTHQISQL